MNALELADVGPLECTPETPWGVHAPVTENVCPRCGWVARERTANASGTPAE